MAVAQQWTQEIKKNVVDELYWDSRIDASRVLVDVSDGMVTLKGTVPSYSARQAAEADARAVAGMASVDNQLKVEPLSEIPVDDQQVKDNAERVLRTNADIGSESIDISVEAGRVTLEGNVSAYWKKVIAADLVGRVSGVTDVNNRIAVVPSEKIDDAIIADQIVHALERNAGTDPEAIHVKVEDGRVTLSGFAPTLHAEHTAAGIARNTAGVKDVVSFIQVQGS